MGESSTAEGTRLGAYRIEKQLGEGAMGEVYVAVHEALGRHVAIKKLKPHVAADRAMTERFFAEARAVNIIRHENIVECTDLVNEGGTSYIVMELLEGKTLSSAIRAAKQIPPVRAVKIAAQIADALAAAHTKGIVHRDLKPDNVFLIRRAGTSDYVKVLDFGMARLRPDLGGVQSTQSGALIGTPAYMSPEQARGEKVGPPADIYALGVVVFHMLTGQLPFSAESLTMMLIQIVQETPPSVDKLAKDIPPPLVELVMRCLAKDPAQRPADMATLRRELFESVGLPFEVSQSIVGEKSPLASDTPSFGFEETLDSGQKPKVDVLGETSAPGVSKSPPSVVAQTTAPAWSGQSSLTSAAAEVSTTKPKPKPWLLIGGGVGAVAIAGVIGIVMMSKGSHSTPAASQPSPPPTTQPSIATPTPPAPTPAPPPVEQPEAPKSPLDAAKAELEAANQELADARAKFTEQHPDVVKAKAHVASAKAAVAKLDGTATPTTTATTKTSTAKATTKTGAKTTTAKAGTGTGSATTATPPPVETKVPPPDDKVDRTKTLVGPKPPGT